MDNEMIERCELAINKLQDTGKIVGVKQVIIEVIKAMHEPTEKIIIQNKMSQQDVEKYQRIIDTIICDENLGSSSNPIIENDL